MEYLAVCSEQIWASLFIWTGHTLEVYSPVKGDVGSFIISHVKCQAGNTSKAMAISIFYHMCITIAMVTPLGS